MMLLHHVCPKKPDINIPRLVERPAEAVSVPRGTLTFWYCEACGTCIIVLKKNRLNASA